MAEWRSDGGLLPAELATLVGVDVPCAWRPVGGENEILGDGFAEVVGDVAGEPAVEQVAFTHRVGRGALDSSVRVEDLL